MNKQEMINYMIAHNVRGLLTIEDMAEDMAVPKGKWISITNNTASTQKWICSICGRTVEKNTALDPDIFFPFCHCGADMREVGK